MSDLRIHTLDAPTGARVIAGDLHAYADRARAAELAAAEARGREAGAAEALANAARALTQAAERYDAARAELSAEAGAESVELAVRIVRQLLRVEVPEGRYGLEEIVRDVLAQGDAGYGSHALRLHPEDAQALEGVALRSGTTIVADADVRRGDVRLETPQGVLVRRLDACVDEIRERLMEGLA